jgi:hypothetical protein
VENELGKTIIGKLEASMSWAQCTRIARDSPAVR